MEQKVSDIFTDREKLVKKYSKEFVINQASSVCAMHEYRDIDLSILDRYSNDTKFSLSEISYLIRHIVLDSAARCPVSHFKPKGD